MAGYERMSLRGRLLPFAMRMIGRNKHYLTPEHVRHHLDELTVRPRPVAPPQRLRKGVSVTAAIENGWRIYRISPTTAPSRGTVVYHHGGGWIHEAASTHWRWVQRLAAEAATTVVMPVYPLVHEGGRASIVVPAVADLCADAAGPVILMGDSAGGSIAMSATLLLKERQNPPAMTVLISPALDLRLTNPDIEHVQSDDPWLVREGLAHITAMWADEDFADPILNPIAGDLNGLPPLMIFSGTRDILNPDTRVFVARALDADVKVQYVELPGHIHVFPLLPLPEGERARKHIITAVRRVAVGGGDPFGAEPGAIGRYPSRVRDAIDGANEILPRSGEVEDMLALLSTRRGRPITLLEAEFHQSMSGLLISTQQADYIAVPSDASPERRSVIVCHEAAHVLLGHEHETTSLGRQIIDSGVVAGVDERLVRSVVAARALHTDPGETDAEIVATHLTAELRRRSARGGDTYYEDRWI